MNDIAKIQIISSIEPIEGADRIELARILGYGSVVKKGEFKAGDKVIFIYSDTIVPRKSWSEFLFKDNRESIVLKKVRLRGVLSEGLVLPYDGEGEVGEDVSEKYELKHYEKPVPACLAGDVLGNFPRFIPKTDSPRLESYPELLEEIKEKDLYAEIKYDGSSMTAFLKDGHFGVCSRNLELKENDKNSFWQAAQELQLEEKMRALGVNLALQMELVGPGIQKNPLGLSKVSVRIFDVFNIDTNKYLSLIEKRSIIHSLGLETLLADVCSSPQWPLSSVEAYKEFVNNNANNFNNKPMEGIVFKCVNESYSHVLRGRTIFKVLHDFYKD